MKMNPRFKENMGIWFVLVSISKLSHALAMLVVFDLKIFEWNAGKNKGWNLE